MHAAAEGTEGQGGPLFWEEAGSRARLHVYMCLLLVLFSGLSAGLALRPFLNPAPVTVSASACTSFANSLPYHKSALLASAPGLYAILARTLSSFRLQMGYLEHNTGH